MYKVIRMYALNVVVVASVALVVAVNASAHRTLQAVDFRDDIEEAINAARKAKGLSKLCINNKLMDAAQTQANDMAENNLVKTTGSDKSSLKDRALAHGFKGEVVTEVVAAGYRTAVSVVDAWSKSQTALETIFSPTITVLGPGYAFDKTKKFIHFWAVDFSTGGCGDSESSDPIPKNTDNQESDASASVDSGNENDATAPSSEAEEEKTSVVTPITDPDDASTNPDKPAVVTAAAPAGNEEETTENPPPSNGVDDAATPDVADDSGNEDISDASPAPGAPAPLNSNAPELEVPTSDASDSEASPIPASDAPESEGPALDASELEASPIPASNAPVPPSV